jgi:hypothetical protein
VRSCSLSRHDPAASLAHQDRAGMLWDHRPQGLLSCDCGLSSDEHLEEQQRDWFVAAFGNRQPDADPDACLSVRPLTDARLASRISCESARSSTARAMTIAPTNVANVLKALCLLAAFDLPGISFARRSQAERT